MSFFIESKDPHEIAEQFSTEDRLERLSEMNEEWKEKNLEKIKEVLPCLPDIESDLIRLYFFKDKTQVNIGEIYDRTQAAISYRINRAIERLEFLVEMPSLDKDGVYDILFDLDDFSERDARIFSEMYESTCQSDVANRLDISQGQVRHRFLTNLRMLGNKTVDRMKQWVNEKRGSTNYLELDDILEDIHDFESNRSDLEEDEFEENVVAIIDDVRTFVELADDVLLRDSLEQFMSLYETFKRIRHNPVILREIQLPKWNDRNKNKIV